jgi:lysylphosphatidylglycerol synthetase-like protein (DUF2156 family)
VHTLQGAHKATRQAFWFALVVVVATVIFSILAIGGVQASSISSPWSLLDAALFGAIAIGIYRHSRVAAVAGLVLYMFEIVGKYMLFEEPIPTYGGWWIIPLAFTLVFLGGVRGAFAYHRLQRAAAQEQSNESKDTAKGDLP